MGFFSISFDPAGFVTVGFVAVAFRTAGLSGELFRELTAGLDD